MSLNTVLHRERCRNRASENPCFRHLHALIWVNTRVTSSPCLGRLRMRVTGITAFCRRNRESKLRHLSARHWMKGHNLHCFVDSEVTQSGEWYLCAQCRTCSGAIPIITCPAPPAPAVRVVAGKGLFTFRGVPCPHCGAVSDYRTRELIRLQVPVPASET